MIFAVIPTFNRKAHLLECLGCLARQDTDCVAVVSDSASSDGTAEAVGAEFPEAVVLAGTSDLWWTGAVNLGLRYVAERAGPDDYFLMLNDDTSFDPDYCSALLDCAQRNPGSVIGSACVDIDAPDRLIDGGVTVNWVTAANRNVNLGVSLKEFAKAHVEPVSVLPGRGTLYPASVLKTVGYPDERRLPHYGADYEYSRRCNRKGHPLIVCYDAVIRSDTRSTGIHAPQSRWSLSSARSYFFGRRSACNLVDRCRYSYLSASNPVSGTLFFGGSVARIVWHYLYAGTQSN